MTDLNSLAVEMGHVSPQRRVAMMRVPKHGQASNRGFRHLKWRDQYWQECSLSESSLAEDRRCIWLGTGESRMHLDQRQAGDLATLLNHFAARGELP